VGALKTHRQRLGQWGENLAARYLVEKGYSILRRNYRTPYGEIDLVSCQETLEGQVLVFVEVKTRSGQAFGYPEESITASKQEHLLAVAQYYLQQQPDWQGGWRIDVIAIQRLQQASVQIRHFENAVR
jgi:putative endonuclease